MDSHNQKTQINIGAGAMRLEGWLSLGLEVGHDVQCDVRKLPFDDDSVDAAMAIHVLEHIQRWEARDTLVEWRRVLKPGAKLAIELPELSRCCRNVLDNPDARYGVWGLFGDPSYKNELMTHKWCWGESELVKELRAVGFKVKVARPIWHGKKSNRDIRVECLK